MPEDQNIEYKQNWRDEHLKSICGFANSKGGRMYIGIDDSGQVIGVSNYKKLLEDIPNKARDVLGITVEMNLLKEDDRYYLEVITPARREAISMRGRFYIRRGGTTGELTEADLTEFLLERGHTPWERQPEPQATLGHIDERTVQAFIGMVGKSGRIRSLEDVPVPELLDKLRLTNLHGQLNRAALVLFGKDPQLFHLGMRVKIGRFGESETDLKHQDVIEGNLFYLFEETLSLLDHKYFTKFISYEGVQRIEKDEYPRQAIREMLLNALVHRNYAAPHVLIRVYDHQLSIWNSGRLPEGLSIENLKGQHASRPRNELIAEVCFKGGLIESWGRGTTTIIETCKKAGLPEPVLQEQDGGFQVTLFKDRYNRHSLKRLDLNDRQIAAVLYASEHGRINNTTYQKINSIGRSVATDELSDLATKGILIKTGEGKGTTYKIK